MANIPVFDPPADVEFAAPFWEAIEAEELRLPQCSVCGQWRWYPDDAGSCTGAEHVKWRQT